MHVSGEPRTKRREVCERKFLLKTLLTGSGAAWAITYDTHTQAGTHTHTLKK